MTLSAVHRPLNPPFRRAPGASVRPRLLAFFVGGSVFAPLFADQKAAKNTSRRLCLLSFATKRQRYPAGKNRNSAFCRRHPQTKPFRQNKRPDCCTERFFCYLCLDDSPACGLFALLHVKTATFKCRGEGARMLRELSAHGPQREVLTCLLSKLRVTGVGSLYLYSAWVVADLHVSMGILGPAPFFFESAGPAIRTGG